MLTKSGTGGLGDDSRPSSSDDSKSQEKSLWEKLSLQLVDLNSSKWFGELGVRSATKIFENQITLQGEMLTSHTTFLNEDGDEDLGINGILDSMQVNPGELGEIEDLETTVIGRAVMNFLEQEQMDYSFKKMRPISHYKQAEIDSKLRLEGQWGTDAGTPFIQSLEVYKDSSGKETGFWFVHLMASPLPVSAHNTIEYEAAGEIRTVAIPDRIISEGGLTFGQVSSKIHLPIFLKKLAYMSETPFPSTQLMTLSRDIAYPKVPNSSRPTPTFMIERNTLVQGYSPSKSAELNSHRYEGQIFPEVVSFGWRFGEESLQHLEEIMPILINGCTYAVSTVEDGFRNFRVEDFPADWDSTLASPCIWSSEYERGGSRGGWPQWIPATELGEISATSEALVIQADVAGRAGNESESFRILSTLWSDGVGIWMASAANSLIYSYLLPGILKHPENLEQIRVMAESVIGLDIERESANAMCNLGLAYLLVGRDEESTKFLKMAIDCGSEEDLAESNFYMSLLHRKNGEEQLAQEFESRRDQAGGFMAKQWLLDLLSPSEGGGSTNTDARTGFCGQCGSKFSSAEQKFCSGCGSARG